MRHCNKKNVVWVVSEEKFEDVVEKSAQRIGTLKKYHIWTSDHVKSYLNNKKAQIWILRVYKLKNSVMAEKGGIRYCNLTGEVSLEGMEPFLDDAAFLKLQKEIKCRK